MDMFEIDNDLSSDTKLYRYVKLEHFMSFVERRHFHLTNVNLWDDKWEVILSKLPTLDDEGKLIYPIYSFHEHLFGQSWSLAQESDAMWRVYSPNSTGIQITTSAKKFKLVDGVERWHLGKVIYFKTIQELIELSKSHTSLFDDALFKRSAFEHEREVRFLTHGDFLDHFESEWKYASLLVDPIAFIEGITIDPRADEWYVDAITAYCQKTVWVSSRSNRVYTNLIHNRNLV